MSADATEPHRYRIDVKRKAGDTFQFHAFYRRLREVLAWLNGWNGSTYRTAAPGGEAAAGGSGAGVDDSRAAGGGAAGWGRRL